MRSATRRPFGQKLPKRSTGMSRPARCSIPPSHYGRWFVDGVCNTCFNAVDRHVAAGRAGQAAIIQLARYPNQTHNQLRRAVDRGEGARRGLARSRGRQGRSCHHLYADGARSRVRHAGLCTHRGHPLCRVRRVCRQGACIRIDDAKPKLIMSASCGIEPDALSNTSRCLTKRSRLRGSSPRPV